MTTLLQLSALFLLPSPILNFQKTLGSRDFVQNTECDITVQFKLGVVTGERLFIRNSQCEGAFLHACGFLICSAN